MWRGYIREEKGEEINETITNTGNDFVLRHTSLNTFLISFHYFLFEKKVDKFCFEMLAEKDTTASDWMRSIYLSDRTMKESRTWKL